VSRLYLEPSTDGPAAQDWSTALILAEARSAARVLSVLAVLFPLGVPSDVVAVGAPQLPVLTFGVLQADRDKPPDEPQP
jgi:hypothetical protein